MNVEPNKAPITAAERIRRMRQRRKIEAGTSCADATTPNASSQTMNVDSETELMEYYEDVYKRQL